MIKKPKSDPIACTTDIRAIHDALDLLGNKWSLLIIHYLMVREDIDNTFKKMEKDIEGISAKMLSKELKMLEFNKVVSRKVLDSKPITVSYAITTYGKECNTVIQSLVKWVQQHRIMMLGERDV